MLSYLAHSSILLAGCAIFYALLLRHETFFQLNRWVLVGSILLSLTLPLISIPAAWSLFPPVLEQPLIDQWFASSVVVESVEPEAPLETNTTTALPLFPENTNPQNSIAVASPGWSWLQIAWLIYWIGVGIFFITFLVQLILLLAKMYILESVQDGKFRIVELARAEAPFSFGNAIFINPASYDLETYQQIIAHEKIHIEQIHFFDKLLAEILVIAFWFNPFVWWYRQAITNNLEYLTDAQMIHQGVEKQRYQMSLLKVSVPQYPLNLSTNYNQSFLKNRITMMNTKKSSVQSIWKYLFILPLFALSILTLNAVQTEEEDLMITSIDETQALVSEKEEKTEPTVDTDSKKLKKELQTLLLKDQLISSEQETVIIILGKNEILINGKTLDTAKEKGYRSLLRSHDVRAEQDRFYMMEPIVLFSGSFKPKAILNPNRGSKQQYDPSQWKRLAHLVEVISASMLDSVPPGAAKDMPQFPFTEVEMKEKLESNPDFVSELMAAIDRYASEVSEWKEELNQTNTIYLKKQMAKEKEMERRLVKRYKERERLEREKLYKDKDKTYKDKTYKDKTYKDKKLDKKKEKEEKRHKALKKRKSMEEHYLKKSRLDSKPDHQLLNQSKTILSEKDKKADHCCWKWPAFQTQLLNLLAEEAFLKNTNKVKVVYGEDHLFINGVTLSNDRFERYHELFHHYNINHEPGWLFQKEGNHIVVMDHPHDLHLIKKDLINYLMAHQLMASPSDQVMLAIPGPTVSLNGKQLSHQHLENIFEILEEHHIQPIPGKEININNQPTIGFHVGYKSGTTFVGSVILK